VTRWARADGQDARWWAASLAGDLGGQSDMERELAREGLDRAALGREAFVERVRAFEAGGRTRAQAQLDDLGAAVDLAASAIDDPATVRAARTAFVRLYDAGRLAHLEQVVDVCPRCETVIDPVDSDEVETTAIRWRLRLALLDSDDAGDADGATLSVDVIAPELLVGAVAVAVPAGHPARGAVVALPVADRHVPVVAGDTDGPVILVPAHDQAAWGLARQFGLTPIEVLDADGIVRVAGPLDGLARFAAREQAAALLVADLGTRAEPEQTTIVSRCCRRCRTMVVPRLGRHWMLAMADFEVAVADIVRDGQVTFHPAAAGDELIAQAGAGGAWCLSGQVWAGQPVPVATCLECRQRAVGVDMPDSCGKCMGALVADDDVLDARFLAAMWPLAVAGWPDHERTVAETAATTMALAGASSLGRWVLPSMALALAVAGTVPFTHVAVPEVVEADTAGVLASGGRQVARAALILAARGGLAAARQLLAGLAAIPRGGTDVTALSDEVASAYRRGAPATAARLLTTALAAGIPEDQGARAAVRRLAGPILGE
jgi:valyl-tRNA synthetase